MNLNRHRIALFVWLGQTYTAPFASCLDFARRSMEFLNRFDNTVKVNRSDQLRTWPITNRENRRIPKQYCSVVDCLEDTSTRAGPRFHCVQTYHLESSPNDWIEQTTKVYTRVIRWNFVFHRRKSVRRTHWQVTISNLNRNFLKYIFFPWWFCESFWREFFPISSVPFVYRKSLFPLWKLIKDVPEIPRLSTDTGREPLCLNVFTTFIQRIVGNLKSRPYRSSSSSSGP